jgi:hypothetical protein
MVTKTTRSSDTLPDTEIDMTPPTERDWHIARRCMADLVYIGKHRDRMVARYPDQWVAMQSRRVYAAHKSHAKLMRAIEARGMKPREMCIQYLSRVRPRFIL